MFPAQPSLDQDRMFPGVDFNRARLHGDAKARGNQIVKASVRKVVPIGCLATDVEGQTTDAEVGVAIGEHELDVNIRRNLSSPQAGADPGIAATDDHQSPHVSGQSQSSYAEYIKTV